MSLSEAIEVARNEANPYSTAVIGGRDLLRWEHAAETLERDYARYRRAAGVFAAVAIGLLFGLIYAGSKLGQAAPGCEPPNRAVMQLSPSEIRSPVTEVYEL